MILNSYIKILNSPATESTASIIMDIAIMNKNDHHTNHSNVVLIEIIIIQMECEMLGAHTFYGN